MGASLHTGNRGVSALGASLAGLIWRSHPDATVSLLIGNRDDRHAALTVDGQPKTVKTVNYRLSPRAPLREQLWWLVLLSGVYRAVPWEAVRRRIAQSTPWINALVHADVVGDIRGGDSFSDIYSVRGFVMGCLPVISVILVRGRIHLLPQTYGPFRSTVAERVARFILLRAESIWCRDRVSLAEVSRLTGGRRQGRLCPDVAFALEAVRPDVPSITPPLPERHGTTLIGLNVNGLVYHGGYTRANMFGLRLDYRTFLQQLVERLLSDETLRLLLVPHTFAPSGSVESDPAACRDLMDRLSPAIRQRVHLVTEEYDQHRIKGVIGMCDFFIGSRMHACIAALSQGIPTVGVAYSRKFAGVFETVGVGDWVVDGRNMEVEDAIQRTEALFGQRTRTGSVLKPRVALARAELSQLFAPIAEEHREPIAQ